MAELVSLLGRASDRARLDKVIDVLVVEGVVAAPVLAGRGRTAEFALVSLPLLVAVAEQIEKVQAAAVAVSRLGAVKEDGGTVRLTLEEFAAVAGIEAPAGQERDPQLDRLLGGEW